MKALISADALVEMASLSNIIIIFCLSLPTQVVQQLYILGYPQCKGLQLQASTLSSNRQQCS